MSLWTQTKCDGRLVADTAYSPASVHSYGKILLHFFLMHEQFSSQTHNLTVILLLSDLLPVGDDGAGQASTLFSFTAALNI